MLAVERLGKYEIVEQIGEGGFGTVWSGRDPLLKRTVAIKTCESDDEELRQRFLREAEIAASLHHPNIVVVHDFGYDEGVPFLVEEFLTGEDLSKVIARGDPVPLATKLGWLSDVCRGLDFAHTHGVIHRDVKPSNVRILENGSAKVLDFGIAKLAEADTQHLTKTGTAIGTVGYMAPEQLSGEPVDFRSDVFSFGVLAYELLTYVRPFEGETVSRVFYRLLHEDPPPLTTISEEIPEPLDRIVLRCLEKSPERRYGSCYTILEDLERVAAGEPLDLESTGEVTTDLGHAAVPRTSVRARRAPATAPEAVAPTVLVAPKPRRAPRLGFVLAAVLALGAALGTWLLRGPGTGPEAPGVGAAPEAAADADAGVAGEADRQRSVPPGPPRAPRRPEPVATAATETEPAPAGPAESDPEPEPLPGEPAEPPALELAQAGPGVVLPEIVERPPLTYPRMALRMRREGVVNVAVLVDPGGVVLDVRPLGPELGYGLDEATAEYARACRWNPGTRDGQPEAMWTDLSVRYSLEGNR